MPQFSHPVTELGPMFQTEPPVSQSGPQMPPFSRPVPELRPPVPQSGPPMPLCSHPVPKLRPPVRLPPVSQAEPPGLCTFPNL